MTLTADRSPAELETAILSAVAERGPDKTVCPSEVARALAGSDETRWRLLMKPLRAAAVRLAGQGRLEIRRKGKPVDPQDFRGIYRLAPPRPAD
ncbi:DUF3253 domain-containing protein [Aurantimonas sp. Leaf443]|uniref:DUF3253 domain-containing protein n=1 Tax=Aurantimonas sp. Leaf443 TaxID=1736378 RepID=UPI0007014FA2|nr:DUF3253 domain-containing protein [Aurantimonas sp. Leaf443]KQT83533.1 hypothetical protein ASG48_13405 [Aurantimonas sp. Leaf443]